MGIESGQWMPDIHHYNKATQRTARFQIFLYEMLPGKPDPIGYLGITIASQIHESPLLIQTKKIELLGTARRFTGTGKRMYTCNNINGAGLPGIGSPGDSDLITCIRRQLGKFCHPQHKGCVTVNWFHDSSDNGRVFLKKITQLGPNTVLSGNVE